MADKTPRGLGKGLSALLGEINNPDDQRAPLGYVNKEIVGPTSVPDTSDILRIPVSMIEANPYQPRTTFNEDALKELSDSIRTLGLIQPITVRKISPKQYQIISGERRFRACKLAGFEMVPAYIKSADDQGMLEMAIVENVQRQDLDPIEVALSYQRLIDECNLTQEEMALRVGKKRSSIANSLRLLKLPASVQYSLKVGELSVGHAKVLLGVENAKLQEKLSDKVLKTGMSVRGLEELVRKLDREIIVEAPQDTPDAPELPDEYYEVLEYMGKYFGDNISLKRNATGKGSLTVRFETDEVIKSFLKALKQTNL